MMTEILRSQVLILLCLLSSAAALRTPVAAQLPQNPSPMVETTRSHPRLEQETPAGLRIELDSGHLYIPESLRGRDQLPLFIHLHGGTWLADVAAKKDGRYAVISIQLGSGSGIYAREFGEATAFSNLLEQAESKSGVRFARIGLTSWSAGYGAVRQILRSDQYYQLVEFVVLIDGLHAGYVSGRPGPLESELIAEDLDVFLKFARDAVRGDKQLIVTHSEIFPGTYASTTETADYLIKHLGLNRTAVLKWGPMGMQQLSEVRQGRFLLLGYAGNSAPDHVDQLHALPDFLRLIE